MALSKVDIPNKARHVLKCAIEECENNFAFYCKTCHERFCKHCRDEHQKIPENTNHEVVLYKHRKGLLHLEKCKIHPTKDLDMFCEECQTSLCSKCATQKNHRGHIFTDLETIYTEKYSEATKPIMIGFTAGDFSKNDITYLLGKIHVPSTKTKREISPSVSVDNTAMKPAPKQIKEDRKETEKKVLSLSATVNKVKKFYVPGVQSVSHISLNQSNGIYVSDSCGNLVQTNFRSSKLREIRTSVECVLNRSLKTLARIENNTENKFETLSNDLITKQSKLRFLQTTISQDQLQTSNQFASLTKSASKILRSHSEILLQLNSNTPNLDLHIHNLDVEVISSVRLVGGSYTGEGRVEVKYHDARGTVCDDGFTDTNAQVVCQQLGYTWNGAIQMQMAPYGQGSGYIVLDDVSCRGTEKSA